MRNSTSFAEPLPHISHWHCSRNRPHTKRNLQTSQSRRDSLILIIKHTLNQSMHLVCSSLLMPLCSASTLTPKVSRSSRSSQDSRKDVFFVSRMSIIIPHEGALALPLVPYGQLRLHANWRPTIPLALFLLPLHSSLDADIQILKLQYGSPNKSCQHLPAFLTTTLVHNVVPTHHLTSPSINSKQTWTVILTTVTSFAHVRF